MMAIPRAWSLPLLVALCGWARGQVTVHDVPKEFEEPVERWVVESEVTESPYHRQRFSDLYAEDIAAGSIFAVATHMIARFDAEEWGENESKQGKILDQLYRFASALDAALQAPGISGPLDTVEEQDIFLAKIHEVGFGIDSLKMEPVQDPSGQEVPGYFASTPNELPLYVWAADGESKVLMLTSSQVRQWRLLENALSNLVLEQSQLVRQENVRDLRVAVERWENYLDNGYSQMPWESLLNGWLIDPPDLGPPEHQWVLLHPSLGIEASVNPLDEARVKESMHVEVLGHVWYRGEKLQNFWGLSASLSLRDDLDPGLGVLVHISKNWNVGVTWHDVDEDPFLFLSFDLFRFARKNANKYVSRYESLRQRLHMD